MVVIPATTYVPDPVDRHRTKFPDRDNVMFSSPRICTYEYRTLRSSSAYALLRFYQLMTSANIRVRSPVSRASLMLSSE